MYRSMACIEIMASRVDRARFVGLAHNNWNKTGQSPPARSIPPRERQTGVDDVASRDRIHRPIASGDNAPLLRPAAPPPKGIRLA